MTSLTIQLDETDTKKLDDLAKRWGFTSREAAASAAMHLLLPVVEQVWTDQDATNPSSSREP